MGTNRQKRHGSYLTTEALRSYLKRWCLGQSQAKLQHLADSLHVDRKILSGKLLSDPPIEIDRSTVWKLCKKFGEEIILPLLETQSHNQVTSSPAVPGEASASSSSAEKARKMDAFAKVLSGEGFAKTLREIYKKYPLFKFGDHVTPLCVFPAKKAEWSNIEAPLRDLHSPNFVPPPDEYGEPGEFDPEFRQRFDQLRQRAGRNDPTFTLQRLDVTSKGVKLHCGTGRYFQAIATCDALEDELIDRLSRYPDGVELRDLPRRSWLHKHVPGGDPVIDGSRRTAGIAISTLTIFPNPEKSRSEPYWCFVHPRSSNVHKHAFLLHVIPSGMFQAPICYTEPHREFKVRMNVLREFYEELFNPDAEKEAEGQTNPEWFHPRKGIKDLKTMLSSSGPKRAKLYYTGLAINLMNLRPEICTLLLIRDPDWYAKASADTGGKDSLKLNGEFLGASDINWLPSVLAAPTRKIAYFMRLDRRLEMVSPGALLPKDLVPPAAAAISLGLSVARAELGIESK